MEGSRITYSKDVAIALINAHKNLICINKEAAKKKKNKVKPYIEYLSNG